MKCPNKKCGKSNAVVYTKQLCATGIHIDEGGELVIDATETQEAWNDVEPEYVICCECEHKGSPEEFGLYSGKFLRAKLDRLIFTALEVDGLGELPDQIISLILPQGGVLIHKGGAISEE